MIAKQPIVHFFYPSSIFLKSWVDSYIILHHRKDGIKSSLPWTIMPDCTGYMIFHLFTNHSNLSLVGPRSVFKNINRKNRVLTLIVKFKPWGLSSVLPFPVNELKDSSIPLSDIFRDSADIIKSELDELARNGDIRKCISELEKFIGKHVVGKEKNHRLEQASKLIFKNFGLISISDIAKETGFSDRYLRKIFSNHIGLSPKRFSMITRVTNVVKGVDEGRVEDWTDLALSSGYFDQSHMIADFNNLLGESPEVFINRSNREEVI